MHTITPRSVWAGLGLALACGLVACADGTAPDANALSADMPEINAAFEDEADFSLGALVAGGSLNSVDLSPRALFPAGLRPQLPTPLLRCLVLDPLPPEDPDEDHIPTLLVATFGEDCGFSRGHGTQFELTGSVTLSDPFPESAGYDLDEVFENFGHRMTTPSDRTAMLVRNGSRSVRQSDNTLTAMEQLTTEWTGDMGPQKRSATDWEIDFDGDETIVFGEALPSGDVTITGTWDLSLRERMRSFTVETVTPLHYDATCTDVRPIRRISSGELHKTLAVDGVVRGVLITTWSACGEAPTREFVPE